MRLKIKPKYDLKKVHEAIKNGNYRVHLRVWNEIKNDFGWQSKHLEKYFLALKTKHFDKPMPMKSKPPYDYYGEIPAIYDVYKSDNIMGENVYTHFYFNEDTLIIDSVHEQ
ncbi:MAG: type II toxin-antitoxin system MqsR family toxin [Desulfobacter sp.]|nr:MAG: type II toxin-antitoxin system MqsR family toxin [Desulfobacter sp.]